MAPCAFTTSLGARALFPSAGARRASIDASRGRAPSAAPGHRVAIRNTPLRMQIDADELARQLAAEMGVKVDDDVVSSAQGGDAAASLPDLDHVVEVGPGRDGMTRVILRHEASKQAVEIYEYGAAVTRFSVRDGAEEVFFLSKLAAFDRSKAIRGGIPICWPQFGPYGPLDVAHGFARVSDWKILDRSIQEDGSVRVVFGLTSDNPGTEAWGKKFEAEYLVTLSAAGLETGLKVRNTGTEPFDFTVAFHNYFKVTDATKSFLFGFENLEYIDRLDDSAKKLQADDGGAGLIIEQETDRIYTNAPEELAVFDSTALRIIKVKKTANLPDATVWNPFGGEGSDPGWKDFVCVEPAAVTTPPVVAPGEEWFGAQLIGFE